MLPAHHAAVGPEAQSADGTELKEAAKQLSGKAAQDGERKAKMDLLSLYSTLQDLRLGFREVPPFWDRDLRELYEARLDEARERAWLTKGSIGSRTRLRRIP
jgi:hypothetical protein